ncbi:hypothetical protein [Halodesulfovibrio marinisediminis]|uniref:Uncharacterized protein n=1 Tax=Halodesulfovibrio marinisediminis DSM 17456 TaxID=1121457 RepID=A0A1N6DJY0_9BACT|nr:hypothetical protein [Halodesulfovibrio marinisediminis]SIN70974.1 hypothetical protein SAMN02745161_0216 [Halodesulfovibrio marinisediminis DSM 17456]
MQKSSVKRYLSFASGVFIIWLFMFVFSPMLLANVESASTLATFIEQNDINSGAIYWSDVEITADAELGARSTVTYLPKGK